MPAYDYKCLDCNKRFEYRRGLDDPHPACPKCDSVRVIVLPPAICVQFKGPGFYVNDYGKKDNTEE